MKATDPDGTTWRVSRRWAPWRRRLKGLADVPSLPALGDDPISLIIGIVLLIVLIPVVIVGVIAIAELLLLLLVLPFAIIARILFGRHWYVGVRNDSGLVFELDGGNYRNSAKLIQELVEEIRLGRPMSYG